MQIFHQIDNPEIVKLLKRGKVGIIPTDTVYGIVCMASDKVAVERLYHLKNRLRKPGTLIAADIQQLADLGIKERYVRAVSQFWPGPISAIIPSHIDYITQGTGSIAVRIPGQAALVQLLKQAGPLQTTSANSPGEPTAATVDEAIAYFGDSVDFYVDGGNLHGNPPSTIIRVVDDVIEVIREGAVRIDESGKVVP